MEDVPIALIEWLDEHDRVVRSTPVRRWPCRLGRAVEVDVQLDDPCTAACHAVLDAVPQGLQLTVGDTINGARVGDRHLKAGDVMMLTASDVCRLGQTRLRVRLPSDPVPAEQACVQQAEGRQAVYRVSPVGWLQWAPWAVLALMWNVWEMWVTSDPDTPIRTYLSSLFAAAGLLGAWALLWSLGSKLFQGRLQFHEHLRLALLHGLAWTLAITALPMLSFMTGWLWPERISAWVGAAVLARLVWAHLCVVQPSFKLPMAAAVSASYATGLGLVLWLNVQNTDQWWSQHYASTMLPSSWRLVPLSSTDRLLDDAAAFKAALDERARRDQDEAGTDADLDLDMQETHHEF